MKVEIVRDTDVGYDPRDHSSSSAQEKPARAHIKYVHRVHACDAFFAFIAFGVCSLSMRILENS